MDYIRWQGPQKLNNKAFICGYCSHQVSTQEGYFGQAYTVKNRTETPTAQVYLYVCPNCSLISFFTEAQNFPKQLPALKYGNPVSGIPDEKIVKLYEEARNSTGVGAYTAAVLSCRKILMHVAHAHGAKKLKHGEFVEYVDFLSRKKFIPVNAKGWVDQIRQKSNEANHEINIMSEEDAKQIIKFTEMFMISLPNKDKN